MLMTVPVLSGGSCGQVKPPPQCRPSRVSYREVDVKGWPESDTAKLRQALDSGTVTLVDYDGCRVQPLWNCTQGFRYEFIPAVEAGEQTEAQMASVEAAPASYVADDFDATAAPAPGCESATHGIVAVRLTADASAAEAISLSPLRPGTAVRCKADEVLTDGVCVAKHVEPPHADCPHGRDPATGECLVGAEPAEEWYIPPKEPQRQQIEALVLRLKKIGESGKEERVAVLLALADEYAALAKSQEAARSHLRCLLELTTAAEFEGHPRELRTYAELVALSKDVGERSTHLEAANRMRERFPASPETSVAYLTLARYYCEEGQPAAAERFFSQMRRHVKALSKEVELEIETIRRNCAPASAPSAD